MHNPLKEEMLKAFTAIYDRNWFLMGEELKVFEKEYAVYSGVKHAIGVSNGLDALFLSLKSVGVGVNDEVIVPSNTFIATVLAVSYLGAKPIFVEPDVNTYNITAKEIRKVISTKTKAIMPVHLFGQACEMDDIMNVAKEYGLYVIEDNAQAHGAAFKGKLTGSWGHVNGTSFYPGKNLGALGDAGAITTDDTVLAEKISILRSYGSKVKYHNEFIGHNMRMDEMQAAFLCLKLKHLLKWTADRQQIAHNYVQQLTNIGDLILPHKHEKATHVYHLFVIRTSYRNELKRYLESKGISTLIHYPIPPHLQEAYRHLGFKEGDFPKAELLSNTSLSLPIWPGMNQEQIDFVCAMIKDFFSNE